jgi:hypothetical protein
MDIAEKTTLLMLQTTNQSIHPVGRIQFQEKFEDTIELIRSCISTMQWLKERETIVHKTLPRKIQIEQQEPN